MASFVAQRFFILAKASYVHFFFFCHLCFWCPSSEAIAPSKVTQTDSSVFEEFYSLSSQIEVFDPFSVNFCVWGKAKAHFILLHVALHLSNLLKDYFFPIELSWHPCPKSIDRKCEGLFLDSQLCSVDVHVCPDAMLHRRVHTAVCEV